MKKDEYIRLNPDPVVNKLPVLTFECTPGHAQHQACSGETYWGGKCQCHCHLPATSQRSKV